MTTTLYLRWNRRIPAIAIGFYTRALLQVVSIPTENIGAPTLGWARYEGPSLNHGESNAGTWQWAYFGDQATHRIFFVAQQECDLLDDIFSYMGNSSAGKDAEDGMVVFGFGRGTGAKSLMTAENVTFRLGFLERKITTPADHLWVAAQITNINNPK